jgi:hypothetical protein
VASCRDTSRPRTVGRRRHHLNAEQRRLTVAEKTDAAGAARAELHASLGRLAQKLRDSRSVTPGDIVFRLSGPAAGNYSLECGAGEVNVVESPAAGAERRPRIEVMGEAEAVRAILDGEEDARRRFVAGGIRVRGDLRYLSDLALELGLLEEPL